MLPYGRQTIDDDDIAAVCAVLRSDWLTTGPLVDAFEAELAKSVGARYAVVCNSGTAALYLAMRASGLQPGDAVIVPAITFVASASANVLAGFEVVFADVDPDTGLMAVENVAEALDRGGSKVKAISPVHMGGRTCDPAALKTFADQHDLVIVEDACHALGSRYGNRASRVGACDHSLAACFSFHPVKSIAMGEGGAITTNSAEVAAHARLLRSHGLTWIPEEMSDSSAAFDVDGLRKTWFYEVAEISHNFRASDINCALGLSQLKKLPNFLTTRRALMARYQSQLRKLSPTVRLIEAQSGTEPGWHLCSVLIDFDRIGISRAKLMGDLRSRGVGSQVHYIPVNTQLFYRQRYGANDLPGASSYYNRTLTLPLFPAMTESDVDRVVEALAESIPVI